VDPFTANPLVRLEAILARLASVTLEIGLIEAGVKAAVSLAGLRAQRR